MLFTIEHSFWYLLNSVMVILEDLADKSTSAAIPPPSNLYGLGSLVADYGGADDNENENEAEYGGDEYGSKTPPAGTAAPEDGAAATGDEPEYGGGDGFKLPPPHGSAAGDDGFKVPTLPGGGGFGSDPFKVPMPPPVAPPRPSVTELIKNPTRIVLMKVR